MLIEKLVGMQMIENIALISLIITIVCNYYNKFKICFISELIVKHFKYLSLITLPYFYV